MGLQKKKKLLNLIDYFGISNQKIKNSFNPNHYFPQQFITQSHSNWVKQASQIYAKEPTKTKIVILPPGVNLNDTRLKEGVVVAERKYKLNEGVYPSWPDSHMFECDVDKHLISSASRESPQHTHFSVYPNYYFNDLACKLCNTRQDN